MLISIALPGKYVWTLVSRVLVSASDASPYVTALFRPKTRAVLVSVPRLMMTVLAIRSGPAELVSTA